MQGKDACPYLAFSFSKNPKDKYKAIKIQAANNISRKSHTGGVKLPQEAKMRFDKAEESNAEIKGNTIAFPILILNLIFFLNRNMDKRKLYPSITIITTA